MDRPSWDEYFLAIARTVSIRSPDAQTKVGCVIVDENNRIVSTGYNGFAAGSDDENLPKTRPDKYPHMIHAEINAIIYAYRDLSRCTLYTTLSPCHECMKAIRAARIGRVVFDEVYHGERNT